MEKTILEELETLIGTEYANVEELMDWIDSLTELYVENFGGFILAYMDFYSKERYEINYRRINGRHIEVTSVELFLDGECGDLIEIAKRGI